MKKLICVMALIGLCQRAAAQSLDDYLAMAVDSNPVLQAGYLEYLAAMEAVPQAGALPDLELSFGYFISPVETRVGAQEARFTAMQMFPWFGTLGAKRDLWSEKAKAKYALFEQERNEVFYNVQKAFFQLYELEQSIRITGRHLEILDTYISLATTRFETASGSMVDMLRIQMEKAELENNLLLLRDRQNPALAGFNQHLNRPAGMEVVLPDTLQGMDLFIGKPALSDSIQARNRRLQSIAYRQLAAAHARVVAKKMKSPSFGLGMNYVLVSERPGMEIPDNGKDAFMPMVSMKIPVFGGKYRAMMQEASLNHEALNFLESAYRNELSTRLEGAWVEYTDAGRRILLYRDQMEKARQAQRILLEAYSTDGKDFEEVLRLQRMLLRYELEIVKAVKDKNTAAAEIGSYM